MNLSIIYYFLIVTHSILLKQVTFIIIKHVAINIIFTELMLKQVRQQDAYLAIRPAYPRGCCPRAAKRIKKLHALLVSLYF